MWQLKKNICLDQNQTVDALSCPYNSHFSFFLAKRIPILCGPPCSQFWGMNYDWSMQITFPLLAIGFGINIKSLLINESKENLLCTLEKYFSHWKETQRKIPFIYTHLTSCETSVPGRPQAEHYYQFPTIKEWPRESPTTASEPLTLEPHATRLFTLGSNMKAIISGVLKQLHLKAFCLILRSSGNMMAEWPGID